MTFSDITRRVDTTEDGDVVFRRTITCKSPAECREATDYLKSTELARRGVINYAKPTFKGKGGTFVWEETYTVDGAEVAIEAANDRWASQRSMMEPEWAQ